MTFSSHYRRLRSLEALIIKNENLLSEVREQRDVTIDPVERAKYEISIKRLKQTMDGYDEDTEKIISRIKQGLLSFYSSNYPDIQSRISSIIQHLTRGQVILLQGILDALDNHELQDGEIYQIWRNDLECVALALSSKDISIAKILQNPRSDIKQRLILSIPFIIGAYEAEWEIGSEFSPINALKKVSETVRENFFRR